MEKLHRSSLGRKTQFLVRWALRLSFMVAVVATVVLLALLVGSTGNTSRFAQQFDILLMFNGLLALSLFIWVVILSLRLYRQVKHKKFGARLTSRFAFFFALVAVIPGVIIYLLSVQFMSRSVESWFNVKVDSALESGLQLGQASLDTMTVDLLNRARILATNLGSEVDADLPAALNRLREDNPISDALVLTSSGNRALAFSSSNFGTLLPQMPPASVINQLRLARQYASTEEMGDPDAPLKSYQIRVIVPIFSANARIDSSLTSLSSSGGSEPYWLQLTRWIPDSVANNLNEVQNGYRDYEELALSRSGIRQLFGITLTMALLLTVFASLGIALAIARRLVEPLLTLAEGTQAVAAGDYRQIPEPELRDEVGQLSRSFNLMTEQLEEARRQVQTNRLQLERSKVYLESVLAGLSTGVIVFDERFCVAMVNKGAQLILNEDLKWLIGRPLEINDNLLHFAQTIRRAFSAHAAVGSERLYWQEQTELVLIDEQDRERTITLLMRGTHLRVDEQATSYLLVFDDISEVISASRAVAWGEVARRLAHEIKNPLTPIQLSAERLQMKLHDKLSEQDAQLLDRSTNTIVNQVFSLKTMVDDFREYARTPPAQLQAVDLNALITDIAILYGWTPEGNQDELLYRQISLSLDPSLPLIEADPTQIRQVFNNVLSNSRDAMEDMVLEGDEPGIKIQTKYLLGEQAEEMQGVRITIEDRGPGFPQHILQKAFEPYVTTKAHGTGLGLAIVRKIIEEHGGKIDISNGKCGGAKISILLARIVKNH
ncbi:MAG: ATP-binding protein [Pelistega sp.]|nr:ATP-binding protein [Pelistega sp.]